MLEKGIFVFLVNTMSSPIGTFVRSHQGVGVPLQSLQSVLVFFNRRRTWMGKWIVWWVLVLLQLFSKTVSALKFCKGDSSFFLPVLRAILSFLQNVQNTRDMHKNTSHLNTLCYLLSWSCIHTSSYHPVLVLGPLLVRICLWDLPSEYIQ